MGILFNVHNQLGNRYQEKYYQRAVEKGLRITGLSYKKEIAVDLTFNRETIGKYFLDFVVEGKVVVELKAVPRLQPKDFTQVLANFRTEELTYRRILNSKYQH